MKRLICTVCFLLIPGLLILAAASSGVAADDSSIKGELREDIQQAMNDHVRSNTLGEEYVIYDALRGEMKRLRFKGLHEGIVKKGEFYVSCADFTDGAGNLYDIDFLVAPKEGSMRVFQAIVHAINGEKRKYHVEGGD